MIIETKYNIWEEVWCERYSRGTFATPQKFVILAILVEGRSPDEIFYKCKIDDNSSITIEESALYPSKEELLKNLQPDMQP